MIQRLLKGGTSLLLTLSLIPGCLRYCCYGYFQPFPYSLPPPPLVQHPVAATPMGYVEPPLHMPNIQDKTEIIMIGGEAKDQHHHHHHHHHHAHQHGHHHAHGHNHKHDHGHDHKHGHNHQHNHGHQHKHGHNHNHDHNHKHGHDHKHGHHHKNLHDHKHGHNHDHKHGHNHNHDHGHEHKHGHGHDHKHGHNHNHDHGHEHKHGHGHDHKHNHGHGHEHKFNHGHGHQHDPSESHQQKLRHHILGQNRGHQQNNQDLSQNLLPYSNLNLGSDIGINYGQNNLILNQEYGQNLQLNKDLNLGNSFGVNQGNTPQFKKYPNLGQTPEINHGQFLGAIMDRPPFNRGLNPGHNNHGHNMQLNKDHGHGQNLAVKYGHNLHQLNNNHNLEHNFGTNHLHNLQLNNDLNQANNFAINSGHNHQYGEVRHSQPLDLPVNEYNPHNNHNPNFQPNVHKSNNDQYNPPYPPEEGFMGPFQDPGSSQSKVPFHHSSEILNDQRKEINKPPQQHQSSLDESDPDTRTQGRTNDLDNNRYHDRRFFKITMPQRVKNNSPPNDDSDESQQKDPPKFESEQNGADGQDEFQQGFGKKTGQPPSRAQDVKRLLQNDGTSISAVTFLQDNGDIVTVGKNDPYLSIEQPLKVEHDGRTPFSKSLESQLNSYFNLTPDKEFKASLAELGDVWNVPLFD